MTTIVYPVSAIQTGYKRYVDGLLKGLKNIHYHFEERGIRKIEFSIRGKPVGGIISRYLAANINHFRNWPVHALTSEVAPRNADITTVHDIIPLTYPSTLIRGRYNDIAYSLSFKNALDSKIIVAPSFWVKKQLVDLGISEERVRVIHEGIDFTIFYPDFSTPYPDNGKIHLVTVGDFNPRKRFDLLYDIVSRNRDLELYHIGSANSWNDIASELRYTAEKSENIRVLGKRDDIELRRYLTSADAFVYISEDEGFGLPPIEALACGTNIVVNDIPIFRETVGGVATLSDIDSFEESILRTVEGKKSKNALIDSAHRYSIEKEVSEYVELYESVKSEVVA